MNKRELWERVRSDEVRVGDVVSAYPVRCEMEVTKEILDTWQFDDEDDFIYRRISDADDPRVLMRALAIAELHDPSPFGTAKQWIDQARHELESEGNDDQAK